MEVRCGGWKFQNGDYTPHREYRDVDREYMIDKGVSSTPRSSSGGLMFESSIHMSARSLRAKFIKSFTQQLFIELFMASIILDTGGTTVNKTDKAPLLLKPAFW